MSTPALSLIIPTFNEAENLPFLLERLVAALSGAGRSHEVIVVDDDSPDKTWQVAEAYRARYPQLKIIRRTTGEKGLSPAVVAGWASAQGEVLGVMDADLQHPPELLARLLDAFEDPTVDVVIASRYTAAGERFRWNPLRKWISRGASNLAQAVLPPQAQGVTDPMSGFFALRRRVIREVALEPKGYKILLEVLVRGHYDRVVEIPYQFGRRHRGTSKLGASVMQDYLLQLWRLIWVPTGFGRFVRYCLVGSSGVVIQLAVLWWLRHNELLGKLRAPAVAVECAIINNFLWNELWTFCDRTQGARRLRDRLRRFASFNLICSVGAVMQLGIIWALAIQRHWNYFTSNLLAIVLITFWNYGLNTTRTWTQTASGAETPYVPLASST